MPPVLDEKQFFWLVVLNPFWSGTANPAIQNCLLVKSKRRYYEGRVEDD